MSLRVTEVSVGLNHFVNRCSRGVQLCRSTGFEICVSDSVQVDATLCNPQNTLDTAFRGSISSVVLVFIPSQCHCEQVNPNSLRSWTAQGASENISDYFGGNLGERVLVESFYFLHFDRVSSTTTVCCRLQSVGVFLRWCSKNTRLWSESAVSWFTFTSQCFKNSFYSVAACSACALGLQRSKVNTTTRRQHL